MTNAMEHTTMAKPKGRPRRSEREYGVAKLEKIIIGKLKIIAGHRGLSVAELLSELVRGPTDHAYARMIKELEEKERPK